MRYGLQKPFFWLLSAFVIAGILIVGSSEQRSTANMKKKHLKNTPEALKQALLEQKIKRRAEGYAKPDQPEKFDILHREIRTQYGKQLPDYQMGYKNIEMEKAGIIRREGEKYVRNQMMSSSTLSWTSRGPSNFLGRSRGLVVDPDDANHLTYYLGSVGGGIWKTTNG
ncbi:MAG TPA: hypothetical protein PLH27_12045, partial [bacterium]|nr:hypothetical protein [bacterium]